jgi:hypothetical protein
MNQCFNLGRSTHFMRASIGEPIAKPAGMAGCLFKTKEELRHENTNFQILSSCLMLGELFH